MTPASAWQVCPACGGDPRASMACATCHGSGVTLPSEDGMLAWLQPLDAGLFAWRAFRRTANAIFHVVLAIAMLLGLAYVVYGLIIRAPWMGSLWVLAVSGRVEISILWGALLLAAFLFFRLKTHAEDVTVLPEWGGEGVGARPARPARPAGTVRDVSKHYNAAAWDVVEQAYLSAFRMGQTEVRPVHLFAATLTQTVGGIFLARLGLTFDKIKDGLVGELRAGTAGTPTVLSLGAKHILIGAYEEARIAHRRAVGPVELFIRAFEEDAEIQAIFDRVGFPAQQVLDVAEWIRVQESLQEEQDRFALLATLKPPTGMNRTMTAQQTRFLDSLSEDLTLAARAGAIGPIIGREKEMDELLRAIEGGRRSVVLVGEPGVGKTALVDGLARRMVEERVPPVLFDKRLVSVHLSQVLAAGDPRMAADRLVSLLREVGASGNIVLVLEGIEALVGAGSGAMDLAELLSAEIDRAGFLVIGTTTPSAWTGVLERRSLGSRLTRVDIAEPDEATAVRMLMARTGVIEYRQRIFFSYSALEQAARLAGRYVHDVHLPQSALNVLQEAAVAVRGSKGERAFVTGEDVAAIIHDKTGVPVQAVTQDESTKLLNLEERLHKRVIGQEQAVTAVAQAMRRARAEVREGRRPIANFLFLGPTGVGKTELAKALAAKYFGDEKLMIRMDMSEYQTPDSAERMIGRSGDDRGGLLTEAVRHQPFSVVLLDELEKAHPDVLTLFLQVMDDGRLTDGVGRTVDFTNVVLIATSNAGTQYIQDAVKRGDALDQIKTVLLEQELRSTYRPEFLNRFDAVIVFAPLTMDDVEQITWLLLNALAKRLEEKGIRFRAEDEAVAALAKAGFDPLFGARPLKRVIQDKVENAVADLMLKQAVGRRDTIVLKADGSVAVEKENV